jgi:hypothetical protein
LILFFFQNKENRLGIRQRHCTCIVTHGSPWLRYIGTEFDGWVHLWVLLIKQAMFCPSLEPRLT